MLRFYPQTLAIVANLCLFRFCAEEPWVIHQNVVVTDVLATKIVSFLYNCNLRLHNPVR